MSDDLLAFTDTRHLTRIIEDNWDRLSRSYKNKVRTAVAFEALNSYRNTVGHNRELRPFERDLLSGISGQVRNQVALYLTNQNAPRRFYPVIESAVDSLGNLPSYGFQQFGVGGSMNNPLPRLQVGDMISFDCAATDPRGLELRWQLHFGRDVIVATGKPVIPYGRVVGERVTLNLCVTPEHVGEQMAVRIELRNSEPYRLYNQIFEQYDAAKFFHYAVDPPGIWLTFLSPRLVDPVLCCGILPLWDW